MHLKILYVFLLPLLFALKGNCQHTSLQFDKVNELQILNYKPSKAKRGKDGDERFTIQLIKGPKSGNNGKNGKTGPDLRAVISLIQSGDTNLLRIIVVQLSNKNISDTFFTNPRYGQIKLIADGGDGGNGGKGETGASPGTGGRGGTGGQITVVFDRAALAYTKCKCLVFSNEGGKGGWSGENYGSAAASGDNGPTIFMKDESGKINLNK